MFYVVMIIVSWNIRGVCNSLKRCRINGALSKLHSDLIGIKESKISTFVPACIAELTG